MASQLPEVFPSTRLARDTKKVLDVASRTPALITRNGQTFVLAQQADVLEMAIRYYRTGKEVAASEPCATIATLTQRIAELEAQLAAARKDTALVNAIYERCGRALAEPPCDTGTLVEICSEIEAGRAHADRLIEEEGKVTNA